jgi:hypothetical protein
MLPIEKQQRNLDAYLFEKRGEIRFSPPPEIMQAMLDSIPTGFVFSDANERVYVNKAAKEKWGIDDNSANFPFDPDDPETESIVAALVAPISYESLITTHAVQSIDTKGNHVPTKVRIEKTPANTITIQIEDSTTETFAAHVRQALHDLNGIATIACGGQQLGLDTVEGRELVEQGITNLFTFTQKLTSLHEQARTLQEPTPTS